ncbi:hypothetical protein ASD19_11220 [Microbacterium sp. Root53]|nr:hypothetical protein ASD19_11220 [Microbacterium sp. Root53]
MIAAEGSAGQAGRAGAAVLPPRQAELLSASRTEQKGNIFLRWITSTDHKTIGYMYLIAALPFFLLGGVMALLIRAELFQPGMQVVPTKEQYNQLFTMHGTIMLLMFATPLFAGFANAIMPLQIGAPDVAFPRLNALSFWLFLFGSLVAVGGFLTPSGASARHGRGFGTRSSLVSVWARSARCSAPSAGSSRHLDGRPLARMSP